MREHTGKFLDKAARAIRSAQLLVDAGETDFAAGRAYYAMFYAAQAMLHERGLRTRKHTGLQALFGEQFAKTGLIDPKYHRWLLDAFDRRLQGDYGFDSVITNDDVLEMIGQAQEFVAEARRFTGVG